MKRNKHDTGQDPYCHEGSGVLINKLGITDATELEAAVQRIAGPRAKAVGFSLPPYDLDYLRDIHWALFADIYEWAGQIRIVDISKGDTRFCNCRRIVAQADRLFGQLEADNYLVDDSREALVENAAQLYVALNGLHPFRDGNGCVQRLLFDHLSANCGYRFSPEATTREAWRQANIAGSAGDCGPMRDIFDSSLGKRRLPDPRDRRNRGAVHGQGWQGASRTREAAGVASPTKMA